jgi:sec-independent protein translocase protein TatA
MTAMTNLLVTPLIANLGATELIIIGVILVLLFGAKKLPELARGSGRALRIFKAETKGLLDDDDDDDTKTPEQRQIDAQNRAAQNQAPNQAPNQTATPDEPGTSSGTTGTA